MTEEAPIEKLTGYRAPLPLLGEMLVALRKERGLSQQDLAEKLDTSQEAIARTEQSRYRSVSLERLLKVADALGASVTVEVAPDAEKAE
jgi:transcriptional regulator with XRE-family HTH domain